MTIKSDVDSRLNSLDALRGIAVLVWLASEILVPALHTQSRNAFTDAVNLQLSPSFWQGLTMRDLTLPTFLFVCGASIVPAVARRKMIGKTKWDATRRVLRRVILLFAIGLICEGGLSQHLPNVRFVGAFQRVAICYAFTATLEHLANWRLQAVLAAFFLFGYGAILLFGAPNEHESLHGSVVATVDKLLLPGRKYFATWDPQGILTTIPALAVTIAGLLVGRALNSNPGKAHSSSLWLVALGIVALNLGFLCDRFLPINPYLWTPSFCLVVIGAGTVLLGLGHAALDVHGWTGWAIPLTSIGRNAIVTILMTEALSRARSIAIYLPLRFQACLPDSHAPACALVYIVFVWAFAYALNRRRLYVVV